MTVLISPVALKFGVALIVATSVPMLSLAQSTTSQSPAPRYSIAKTENGFVRVDGETGKLSFCSEREGKLTCRMAADERSAYQSELEAMNARLAKLESRLAKLEAKPAEPNTAKRKSMLPDDEELDQALKFADKAMRRFFGLVQELKRDFKSDKS